MPFLYAEPAELRNRYLQKLNHRLTMEKRLRADVLRLDLVHPVVSGNKYFKLRYHIEAARQQAAEGLLTLGGAWSNHIVATAYAAAENGLKSIGIIRGEQPKTMSATLRDALYYGMQLEFVSREEYRNLRSIEAHDYPGRPGYYVVQEGGSGEQGIKGASTIVSDFALQGYDYLICAVGTGTTMTGILSAASSAQEVIGIPVLKVDDQTENDFTTMLGSIKYFASHQLFYEYHWGGYARYDQSLLAFMNELYEETGIPTDIVYTSKLFYAVLDLANKDYFHPNSSICVIHSGGLQGNRSLSTNDLRY